MQYRYWVELQTLKAHAFYLELYQLHCEHIERWISGILALASSSSIAGWVIWKEHAFVWACFIMASQVISTLYRYLPFKARIKPLGAAGVELAILANAAEKGWYEISTGNVPEEEINKKMFALRDKSSAILKSAFGVMVIPENEKLLAKAEKQMHKHFKSHYPELQDE